MLGRARLAQIAVSKQTRRRMYCRSCRWSRRIIPDAQRHAVYQQRRETFRRLLSAVAAVDVIVRMPFGFG